MEQKDKNNHNDFDYANFENELSKPYPKQKSPGLPSNLLKENNRQEFTTGILNENEQKP